MRRALSALALVLLLPAGADEIAGAEQPASPVTAGSPAASDAAQPPAAFAWRGLRLVDALEELRARGLRLVYSTSVVPADALVGVEPSSVEPRAILDEILAPLGLEARPGPGDLLVVLKTAPFGAAGAGAPALAVPAFLAEIVVTPGQLSVIQEEQAPLRTVVREDALLVPTIGGDISRVVELLPGVTAPDSSAAFNVRGGAARDVSMVLDGFELYEPFHLLSLQSPFSFVDSKIVESIDFIGGGLTAELGDRFGGFVELSTESPRDPGLTAIELGTLNSRVSSGGRIPRTNATWLASLRAWYPQAVGHTVGLGEQDINTRFGDAYGKTDLDLGGGTHLSLHALLARDRLTFVESMTGNETVTLSNRSGSFWASARKSWGAGVDSVTTLSAGRIVRSRDGRSEPENDTLVVTDDRDVNIFGLRNDTDWTITPRNLLRAGLDIRRLSADYDYSSGLESDPASGSTYRLHPSGTSWAAYVAYRASITPRLATEAGLRWDHQSLPSDDQVSPRLNALWRFGDRSDLRVAWGRYAQSQRIHELAVEDGETEFRPAELSRQVALTLRHAFPRGIRIQADAYQKSLSRLQPRYENLFNPIELFPETESDRVKIAADSARLRGLELLAGSNGRGPLDWWASYVLSSADDREDGRYVPRSWDQLHAGKFLVGWRPGSRWLLSLSGTAHTGWPTTPVTGEEVVLPGGGTEIQQVNGERNSDRFPWYLRFDAKAARTFDLTRGRLRFELDLVNLTNRKNICCVEDFFFDRLPDGSIETDREVSYWLGFTPSFSVLWEF